MTMIGGGCHCGNLRFDLRWPTGAGIPARRCGCSFCTRHGGVWTSHPRATLVVRIRDPARVSRYRFGTRTADFHVCTECGAVPVVTCRIDGRDLAVVNVNCFDDPGELPGTATPADFGGEAPDDRLARRARNWIGDVRVEA